MIRSRWLPIIALLAVTASSCSPTLGDRFAPTAAVVNGEKLSESVLSKHIRWVRILEGAEGAQAQAEFQRRLLAELIQEVVISQQARRMGITVDEDEIRARIERVVARYPSRETFLNLLKEGGLDLQFVGDRFGAQVLAEKVRGKVGEQIEISEEELVAFYELRRQQFELLVHIAHIQICANLDPVRGCPLISQQDRATAKEVAARARAGEDFRMLAKEYSVDGSTKFSGGSLGWHDPSGPGLAQFPQLAQASDLPAGRVSDPAESAVGIHIFKVLARGKTFEVAREEIREALAGPRIDELFHQWLADKIRGSTIEVDPAIGRFDMDSMSIVPVQRTESTSNRRQGGSVTVDL